MNSNTLLVLYGCLVVTTALPIYRTAGYKLSLSPNQPPPPTSNSILWKHNNNKVIDWDQDNLPEAYAQFKHRAQLNTSTGELVLTGLTTADSGFYTVEVDGRVEGNTSIVVLNPVPKPTVQKTCVNEDDASVTSCSLSCEGGAVDAGHVDYYWRKDEETWMPGTKTLRITTGEDSEVKTFSCRLKNRVGEEDGEPLNNPLAPAPIRIKTALVVGISLVMVLIVIVLLHRCRTGVWFFNKGSMPWEADFWRKDRAPGTLSSGDSPPRDEGKTNIHSGAILCHAVTSQSY